MRMEVEKIICDRCGKDLGDIANRGATYWVNSYRVATDFSIDDENLSYEYHELCWRCSQTVQRRLEAAGPLKGAPKGPSDE